MNFQDVKKRASHEGLGLIYVLLDGVGDRPDPNLNWVTPLEAAYTPHLDSLARQGVGGLVYPVGTGVSPESDIAVFGMLGYDFPNGYFGRGVVEAVGAGLPFNDGDLALRANFSTVNEDLTITDRRVGRGLSDEEAKRLAEAVNRGFELSRPGASFQLKHTIEHRAVLVIRVRGFGLSGNVSNTDPAYLRLSGIGVAAVEASGAKIQPAQALDEDASSKVAAELVNEFTKKATEVLRSHPVNLERAKSGKIPANALLLRDAGSSLPRLINLSERFGLRFACLVDLPVERGIARMVGMAECEAGGKEEYEAKVRSTSRLIEDYEAVYIHIKGPDEPGHDGNHELKKRVIEDIDRRFFGCLVKHIDLRDKLLVVSSDHSTPCQLKSHSSDPVPLLICGREVKSDGTRRFTEGDVRKGSLGILRGIEVLQTAVRLL